MARFVPATPPTGKHYHRTTSSAVALLVAGVVAVTALSGCGMGKASDSADPILSPALSGKAFGGPNPIIGATVKLYTTGNSSGVSTGYGVATMQQEATQQGPSAGQDTTTGGAFSFAGGYHCPAGQFAYIVVAGGNTGASGTASGAAATATYNGVTGTTITSGGTGYTTAPTVTITSADGPGSGATATATVTSGVVTGISITSAGNGYDTPPLVSFGGPGTGAAATTTVATGGAISSITVTSGGSGYYSATATISPSDSNGSGATANAIVTNGSITKIAIISAGSGYDAVPNVNITSTAGGYNSPANTNSVLVAALGRCEDLYNNAGGGVYTGYKGGTIYINELTTVAAAYALGHFSAVTGTGASTVIQIGAPITNNAPQISGVSTGCTPVNCGGTGATATAAMSSGAVSTATVTAPGTGYTVPPTITIIPGTGDTTGTGATATATVSGGALTAITITSGGSGYTVTPTISISPGAAAAGLAHAFLNAANLVNVFTNTGTSAGANSTVTPAYSSYLTGYSAATPVVPQALINTLGNILVACVNSAGGVANDGSACGTIFKYTTLPSVVTASLPSISYSTAAPTNTFTAMANLAVNPSISASSSSVTSLFGVIGAFTSVYSPSYSAAPTTDYSIAIQYPTGLATGIGYTPTTANTACSTPPCQGLAFPVSAALDINDIFYVGNQGTAAGITLPTNVLAIGSNGALLGATTNTPTVTGSEWSAVGMSVDGSTNPNGYFGNGVNSSTTALGTFTSTGGALSAVTYKAVDATNTSKVFATTVDLANNVWTFGSTTGGSSIYMSPSGGGSFTGIAATPAYTTPPTPATIGFSMDPGQNLWVSNNAANSVLQNTGTLAAPTYTNSPVALTTAPISFGTGVTFTTGAPYIAFISSYKTTPGIEGFTPILGTGPSHSAEVASVPASTLITGSGTTISGAGGSAADGAGAIFDANYNNGTITPVYSATSVANNKGYKINPCNPSGTTCTVVFGSSQKPNNVWIDSTGSVWETSTQGTTGGVLLQVIGIATPVWPLLSVGKIGQP